MTPFSIDECAWSEQYTRRRGTSVRPESPSVRTSGTAASRAAAMA